MPDNLTVYTPNISVALLRVAMSFVFLWFGISQLQNPSDWVGFLPAFMLSLPVAPDFFIMVNGLAEIILGLLLLLGLFTRPVAFLLALHLTAITVTLGFNSIGVRDFGLTVATLSIALSGEDIYTLDYRFSKRRKGLQRLT